MKKIFVFVFIVLIIGVTYFVKNSYNPLFTLAETYRGCLIVKNGSLNEGEIISCGDVDFVYLTKEEGLNSIKKVPLEGLEFYMNNVDAEEILNILKATVVQENEIENLRLIYAYSPYYQDSVMVDGKKVNLQLAFDGDNLIAGFPLILTGF